jgi:DNA repair protein RadC
LRPREEYDRLGRKSVSDDVLLAILIRSGSRGLNVYDLSRLLLSKYGSLTALSRASEDELAVIKGMGRVKAQVVCAALELARRLNEEASPQGTLIKNPAEAADVLINQCRGLHEEVFWVMLLNTRNHLQGRPVEISRGILDASLVHAREVFRPAIHGSAAAIILAHNHPSGDPSPSREDLAITRKLIQAGHTIGIPVLDHVVLGLPGGNYPKGYVSIRESGAVDFKASER